MDPPLQHPARSGIAAGAKLHNQRPPRSATLPSCVDPGATACAQRRSLMGSSSRCSTSTGSNPALAP